MLEQFGALAMAVATTEEALAVLTRDHADVLVNDLAMPHQDSFDMIRRIRTDHRFGDIPAAALSGYADAEHRSRAIEAGFSGASGQTG